MMSLFRPGSSEHVGFATVLHDGWVRREGWHLKPGKDWTGDLEVGRFDLTGFLETIGAPPGLSVTRDQWGHAVLDVFSRGSRMDFTAIAGSRKEIPPDGVWWASYRAGQNLDLYLHTEVVLDPTSGTTVWVPRGWFAETVHGPIDLQHDRVVLKRAVTPPALLRSATAVELVLLPFPT